MTHRQGRCAKNPASHGECTLGDWKPTTFVVGLRQSETIVSVVQSDFGHPS